MATSKGVTSAIKKRATVVMASQRAIMREWRGSMRCRRVARSDLAASAAVRDLDPDVGGARERMPIRTGEKEER